MQCTPPHIDAAAATLFENLGHTTRTLEWILRGQSLPLVARAAARLEQLEEANEIQVSVEGGGAIVIHCGPGDKATAVLRA